MDMQHLAKMKKRQHALNAESVKKSVRNIFRFRSICMKLPTLFAHRVKNKDADNILSAPFLYSIK